MRDGAIYAAVSRQISPCPPHLWHETGRREPHTNVAMLCGRSPRVAVYVRCLACGQNGFQYPPHRVIYTWRL